MSNQAIQSIREHQAKRTLCMIPGPIEFHEHVLEAMTVGATSHVDPGFINIFGETIEMVRKIVFSKDAQPFIVAGSGTLGWDMVATNLVESGENVLVITNGYFGDKFGLCLQNYGANVTFLPSDTPGNRPSIQAIEQELSKKKYKLVTVTHVDTSTGVLADIANIGRLVRQKSPETLVVVDGVCSVGCEEIRFDDFGLDIVLTGSQKALGAPPGLSIVVASQRAIQVYNNRKSLPASYYAGWNRWIPIMQGYESRKPTYFATPAVQLVMALNVSLKQLLAYGVENNFAKHREVSDNVKNTLESWGLKLVPVSRDVAAHAMTAVYYPEGVQVTDLLPKMAAQGITIAGGLHPTIAAKYFRIGHMGISVTQPERGHIQKVLSGVQASLRQCGYKC